MPEEAGEYPPQDIPEPKEIVPPPPELEIIKPPPPHNDPRGVDTMLEPPTETHYDQILYDKDTTPIEKEVIPKLAQIKTKEKQEELSSFHSPELAENLNLERVYSFIEEHTRDRPTCQVIVIPEDKKQEFIEQNNFQGAETHVGGYIPDYDLVYVYIPQGEVDSTRYESTLVHELTHAGAYNLGVANPDNEPQKYVRSKRLGMAVSDSGGYGRFFEEMMPAHLQFIYLQEYYTPEQFDQAIKTSGVTRATNINELVTRFQITGDKNIDIPHKYFAMPKNNNRIYSDSFHAAIYDEMEAILKKKGFDFTQMLIDARQDPHKIKELARSIDQVLGKGTYIKLQKTPPYKVQELVQIYDFVKHHPSKRPQFLPKFLWNRAIKN